MGRPRGAKTKSKVKIDVPENYSQATRDFLKVVVKELNARDELSPLMTGVLYLLRDTYECFVKGARQLYEEDEIVITTDKTVTANPAVGVMLKANQQVLALMKELGLTTKSRKVLDNSSVAGRDALSLFCAEDFDK